jgi:uncharacterized protein (DUF433 family)
MFNKKLLEERIVIHPDIQHGKPCIKGIRTPVYVILEALATGMDFETIKKEFAPITIKDIQAGILYAALLANEQEVISPVVA